MELYSNGVSEEVTGKLLELDRPLANLADTLGTLLILVALAWAAYLLWLLNSTPRRASDLSG